MWGGSAINHNMTVSGKFIPPSILVITGGWYTWHCFTHIDGIEIEWEFNHQPIGQVWEMAIEIVDFSFEEWRFSIAV